MKIETFCGDRFSDVVERAKSLGGGEFDFNGILVKVKPNTDSSLLERDLGTAFLLGWETIGPNCKEYSKKTLKLISEKEKENELRREKERLEYEVYYKQQEAKLAALVEGVEFNFKDKEGYESWLDKNTDPYGKACFDYAIALGKLLQIGQLENHLDFFGITGFQREAVTQILKRHWDGPESAYI